MEKQNKTITNPRVMRRAKKLKLFVWEGIRREYTAGIGFALAETKEKAIEQIKKRSKDWEWSSYAGELLANEPKVYDKPYGFWMSGGG